MVLGVAGEGSSVKGSSPSFSLASASSSSFSSLQHEPPFFTARDDIYIEESCNTLPDRILGFY